MRFMPQARKISSYFDLKGTLRRSLDSLLAKATAFLGAYVLEDER
ncbi:MAG TPA: hypothetical protein V6D14_08890 [Coleofasciculaceae cyanobacterium]